MPDVEPDREIRIDTNDARASSNEGVVRWVLLISLSLAIIALTVIWVTGALSQDAVEGAGTATGRAKAVQEARESGENRAEQADLIAPGTEEASQIPVTTVGTRGN